MIQRVATDALIEIFKKMNPGEPVVIDTIRQNFRDSFFDRRRYDLSRVGRYKVNKKLSCTSKFEVSRSNLHLTIEDVIGIISYLINLTNGKGKIDDIDHLCKQTYPFCRRTRSNNGFSRRSA